MIINELFLDATNTTEVVMCGQHYYLVNGESMHIDLLPKMRVIIESME